MTDSTIRQAPVVPVVATLTLVGVCTIGAWLLDRFTIPRALGSMFPSQEDNEYWTYDTLWP